MQYSTVALFLLSASTAVFAAPVATNYGNLPVVTIDDAGANMKPSHHVYTLKRRETPAVRTLSLTNPFMFPRLTTHQTQSPSTGANQVIEFPVVMKMTSAQLEQLERAAMAQSTPKTTPNNFPESPDLKADRPGDKKRPSMQEDTATKPATEGANPMTDLAAADGAEGAESAEDFNDFNDLPVSEETATEPDTPTEENTFEA